MLNKVVILILVLFIAGKLMSQDTLPNFTLIENGNRAIVSWTNPYTNLVQLNVQRSYDSLRNYSTIFSAPSPQLAQNGYTDNRAYPNKVYYRIFYVIEGGRYFFSKVRRATGIYTAGTTTARNGSAIDNKSIRDLKNTPLTNIDPADKRIITVKVKDAIFRQLSASQFRLFRDSILNRTKDTLYALSDSSVALNLYVAQATWRASSFIYANNDGYINISLPQVAEKKYHVKFFEENGTSLFDINNIKESPLILDKSSFIHSGWFLFELYEDNKLKEKNKIYLPKDF